MLIIWGLKTSVRLLGMVTVACSGCHNPAAHRLEERRRIVTLFFLPVLPLGRRNCLTCSYCGLISEVPADAVPGLLQHAHDRADAEPRPSRFSGTGDPE
jgi:hypothetical protein